MKTLKIGKLKVNPIILAPMVDITDLPYRLICKKAGAGIVYTPMLYTSQLIHTNPSTLQLIKTLKKESPVGIQVTGSNLDEYKKILPILKEFDLVDINCGCPSIKLINSEAGSFLLKTPETIYKIIKYLKSQDLTVTAKIRLGFEKNEVEKIAKLVEKAGADAITIHARLAIHSNSTPADWKEIEKVKKLVKIPVIGNGDVISEESVEQMLKICDGVMIARAAIGDPLIFKRINYYLKTGKKKPFSTKDNLKLFLEYIKLSKKNKVENPGRAKYMGSNFIRNFPGASKARNEFMKLHSLDEMNAFIKLLLKQIA